MKEGGAGARLPTPAAAGRAGGQGYHYSCPRQVAQMPASATALDAVTCLGTVSMARVLCSPGCLLLWTAAHSASVKAAGKIPWYMEKPVSPRIRTEKWAVAVCWDQVAQLCLSLPIFFFFSPSISLTCLLWFCKKWLEKFKVPNFSSFIHMCCAPQARQHILVDRLRRTFTTLPLKNSLYFSCWAGSHPMWHSSMSHAVTATASMETHQSMRPVVG